MAKYRYAGPGPAEDPDDGTIVRPGDEREMTSCPWGPWEPVDGAESESAAPATQPPAEPPGNPPADDSAPASTTED